MHKTFYTVKYNYLGSGCAAGMKVFETKEEAENFYYSGFDDPDFRADKPETKVCRCQRTIDQWNEELEWQKRNEI